MTAKINCRICLDEDDITNMTAPCACIGSQQYVHYNCLEECMKRSNICSVCKKIYNYNIHINILELLLKYGDKSSNICSDISLHWAVEQKNVETIKLSLENGADVNKEDEKGNTPLHLAVKNKNIEVAKLLLENKANVNSKNTYGGTPLHCAVENKNIEITKFLVENKANVNFENTYGDTPLLWGIYKNCNIEIVRLLLENRANVNYENKKGETPLHWAVKNKNIEVVRLLLENGAKVNKEDINFIYTLIKNNTKK